MSFISSGAYVRIASSKHAYLIGFSIFVSISISIVQMDAAQLLLKNFEKISECKISGVLVTQPPRRIDELSKTCHFASLSAMPISLCPKT